VIALWLGTKTTMPHPCEKNRTKPCHSKPTYAIICGKAQTEAQERISIVSWIPRKKKNVDENWMERRVCVPRFSFLAWRKTQTIYGKLFSFCYYLLHKNRHDSLGIGSTSRRHKQERRKKKNDVPYEHEKQSKTESSSSYHHRDHRRFEVADEKAIICIVYMSLTLFLCTHFIIKNINLTNRHTAKLVPYSPYSYGCCVLVCLIDFLRDVHSLLLARSVTLVWA
jgi:hypothetical protein